MEAMKDMIVKIMVEVFGIFGCYVSVGTFTRLGLCRLPYDKALGSRVLSISREERLMSFW
jgi:hypothetical protein